MSVAAMRIDGLKVAKARLALPRENGRPISQAKLAERAGMHWVTLSNIERGKTRNTTLDTAGKLSQALNVDMAELLADAGEPAAEAASSDDDEEADVAADLLRALQRLVKQSTAPSQVGWTERRRDDRRSAEATA